MNFIIIYFISIFCIILINGKTQEISPNLRKMDTNQVNQKTMRNSDKNSHINNKQLLGKLGLSEIWIPPSHNRKRLAVESRRHSHPDDSKVFIVKLPPNPHYYVNSKLTNVKNNIGTSNDLNKMSFKSNGKLNKIYHWNLPVLKKIISDRIKKPTGRHHNTNNLIDIKRIPTWTNSWENETIEKSYGNYRSVDKKSSKKSTPIYFAPHNYYKTGNNFNQNFPGNGKLNGFYVIKKSGKRPSYYKKLIS